MSILVTGGAGFIGKNLILYLVAADENCDIIVLDNFKTSSRSEFDKFAINIKNVTLYECDIINSEIWQTISLKSIKQIYHLASIASPILYKKSPLDTLDVGYIGTRNVLEYAAANNSTVLFASSSEIYGEANVSPQPEEYYGNTNTVGERSSYDCSKRVGEALMYTFNTEYNVDIRIARIFNTYGPHMNLIDGRFVTEVIKSIIKKTPLTVYGDGTQKRSFCYISDTVSMLYKLMQSRCVTPVNIGCDDEVEIKKIIENLQYESGGTIDIVYAPLTQNDPLHRCPNLLKNKSTLGDTKYTELRDGLSLTLAYFQKQCNFFL